MCCLAHCTLHVRREANIKKDQHNQKKPDGKDRLMDPKQQNYQTDFQTTILNMFKKMIDKTEDFRTGNYKRKIDQKNKVLEIEYLKLII